MENIIAKVTDKDFNLPFMELDNPSIRYAARSIVLNDDGCVAVFHKKNKNEYKLPGGGVEPGEDKIEALKREVLEEAGCDVEILDYLGETIEEKSKTNFLQISYVYLTKVIENKHQLFLTQKEMDEGGEILWLNLDTAYEKVNDSLNHIIGSKYDSYYQTLFMVKRDALILKYYIDKIKK